MELENALKQGSHGPNTDAVAAQQEDDGSYRLALSRTHHGALYIAHIVTESVR